MTFEVAVLAVVDQKCEGEPSGAVQDMLNYQIALSLLLTILRSNMHFFSNVDFHGVKN